MDVLAGGYGRREVVVRRTQIDLRQHRELVAGSRAATQTDVAPPTPVDSNAATNTVAEGAAAGTLVGIRQHLATRNCWLEGAEELLEVLRDHFHTLAESLGEDPAVKQSLCEPDRELFLDQRTEWERLVMYYIGWKIENRIVESDEFDNRGVQLVRIELRCGAAFVAAVLVAVPASALPAMPATSSSLGSTQKKVPAYPAQ